MFSRSFSPRWALVSAGMGLFFAVTVFADKPRPSAAADPNFEHRLENALQKNPTDAEAEALLAEAEPRLLRSPNPGLEEAAGLLQYRLSRWDNARLHLGRLAAPSARALDALARCHYELGDFQRAADAFAKAGDPARGEETWRLFILSLQNSGRNAEAIRQWELFRQHHAAPDGALEFLARAYRRPGSGNREKLLPVLEDLLRLKSGAPEEPALLLEISTLVPKENGRAAEIRVRYLKLKPESPKVWRELAECYEAQKNDAKTADAYLKAARYAPGDGAFLLKAADAVAKTDPATASGLYAQALPLLPREPRIPMALGRVRESFHLTEQALSAYAEALHRAPGLPEARERMVALLPSAKDPGGWLPLMIEAEKGNPKDHAFQFQIAKALAARGDSAQSGKYLDKALRQSPDRREYRQLLPRVLTRDGQITRHLADLETLRRDGDASPELLALLCRGYSLLQNPGKAAETAKELLRLDPARAATIRSTLFDAWAAKDAALALKLCDNFLAKNPGDLEARRIQASATVAAGAPPQKQREAIQALLALDPAENGWWFRLAELELAAKDSAAAFTHAETWGFAHPNDIKGQFLLRDLARGRKPRTPALLFALNRLALLDSGHAASHELEIADRLIAEGDADQAVEILARLVPLLRKDAGYWHRFGLALQQLGRESAPLLERAWKMEPGNAAYARDFSRTLAGDSTLIANIGALGAALQGDSSPVALRVEYARACYLSGNIPASAAMWDEIVRRDPFLGVEDSTAALAFATAGQNEKAAVLLEQRSAKFPRDTRTLSLLADLYERAGKAKEKVRALERLLFEDPASPGALPLAREKEKAGDFRSALRLYSKWCRSHPQDLSALKAYCAAATGAGDTAAWLEALRLPGADRSHRFELAELEYARGGDPADLERLIRENPDYRKGRLLLARDYGDRGDFRNLARFETFLEQESKASPDLLEPLADLKASQGEWEAAHKVYFAWMGAHPKNPMVIAKVLGAAREHPSPYLAAILRVAVEQNPEDAELQAQYAVALGKTNEALSAYETLLQKSQENPGWIAAAAELAKSLGKRDLALRWFEAWSRLAPENEKPLRTLSELHEQAGDKRALAEDLAGLLELRGGDRELILRLARLREDLGQWEPALIAYRTALYLNPGDKAVRDKLAGLLRRPGFKDAAELASELQTLDSGAHEAQFELARQQIQKGHPEKAYAYLITALGKSPHNPNYLSLLPHAIRSREQLPQNFTNLLDLEMNPGLDRNDTANAYLFLHLARAYALKEKWDAAAMRYAEVFRLQPQLLRGDHDALTASFKAKSWPLAAALADAWSELHPESDPETLRMQLLAYEQTRRGDVAIRRTLRRLATYEKDNTGLLLRLAELDARAGDTAAAQENIRQCLLLRPNAAAYAMLLPLIERRPDQGAAYAAVLEKLALLDSARRIECWTKLADYRESRRDLREAHRLLGLLTQARPKNAAMWFRLGRARSQIQWGDGGLSAFERAWELAPNEVDYARALAQSLDSREEIRDHHAVFRFLASHAPTPSESRGLARALLYRGDIPGAAAAWDVVLKFPEERAQLQMEAAETYWRAEQWAKALPYYEMRLAREPNSLGLLDTLQSLYSRLRLEERRVRTVQQMVRLDPLYKDFQLQLAQAKDKSGESAEALSQYARWTARHPDAVEPLKAQLRLADSLRDTSALQGALRRLARLPRPENAHLCRFAELEYHLSGDIEPLQAAVKANSGCAFGKVQLAREYHRRGQFPLLAPFEPELAATAASIDPELNELLGDLYAFQNKKDKANAAYSAWLLHRRDRLRKGGDALRPDFRLDLEKVWKYAEATGSPVLSEVLEMGTEVFPDDADLAHAFAQSLGQTPKALAFYQQWLKTRPDDVAALPRATAIAASTAGGENWPQARAWIRRLTELRPAEIAGWKSLRDAAEKLGDSPTRIAALERLSDLQPDDAAAAFALGTALAKNDRARAVPFLMQAAALKPGEKTYAQEAVDALEALADSALRANNRPQATEWYSLLLELAPAHRKANLYEGLACAQNRDYAAAAPLLRTGLQQSAEPAGVQAEAWRELGHAEAALKGPEAALPDLEKALALNAGGGEAAREFLAIAQSLELKTKLPDAYAAVLRLDSGRADALSELASLRLASGAYNEAARLLRRLTQIRPEDPAAFADLGRALSALNRDEEAKTALTRAYQLGSRAPEAVEKLFKLLRKAGALQEAIPVLEEWLRQNPGDGEASAWAAELAEQRHDWRKAGELWALAWQGNPGQIRFLENLGKSYVRRGEGDYAIELLESQADKLSPEGLILLGDAYAATFQNGKALEAYRKANVKKPTTRAASAQAFVWLARKQPAEAEPLLDLKAAAVNPDIDKAHVRLFLLRRDVDSAATLVMSLAGAHPADAEIQMLLGEVWLARQDGATALKAFEAASKLDTALPRALYLAGIAYLELGRNAAARSTFFALGEKSGRRARALGFWGLGEAALRTGQIADAKNAWMQSLALQPTPQGFSDLAALYIRDHQPEDAEIFARRALEMEEGFPDALAVTADVMLTRSQAKEARALVDIALHKTPASCELLFASDRIQVAGGKKAADNPIAKACLDFTPMPGF